jgi:uncharacterized membrane protein YfcA
MSPTEAALLITIGALIGGYATSIGAGGGFLIAPLLLLRYPDAAPAEVTTASLTVVLITSLTSTVIVSRERRVDFGVISLMGAIAIPAALIGAATTGVLPRRLFALIFALLLLTIAIYILWRPVAKITDPPARAWRRQLIDREGNRFLYRIPIVRSIIPNAVAGFVAALAGIGGGPIGIPIMTRVMHLPHAIAVPSMHVLIAAQTTAVLVLHFLLGHSGDPMADVPWLAIGLVVANPAGQWLRRNLGEGHLMRALAIGLFIVAARTALEVF